MARLPALLDRPPLKLIKAGRLVDGRGGAPVERGALLIEGSRIIQVGPERQVAAPLGAQVAEYAFPGKTLLPGLVDCHVHLTMPGDGTAVEEAMDHPDEILVLRAAHNARKALESGTTTLRDCGAKHSTTFLLRNGVRQGVAVGPRLLLSGRPVTITGGHCWMMGSQADGVDGVRREVRRLVTQGADFIKIMATGGSTRGSNAFRSAYTREELRAAIDEAHRSGRRTAVHCLCNQGIADALEAGADMLIHGVFADERGHYSFDPSLAERIARAGVPVNPTIHVRRAALWSLSRRAQEAGPREDESRQLQRLEEALEQRVDNARRLHRAGVKLVAGSDSGWGVFPVGQFARELETMVDAGLTPGEVVLAATRDAAQSAGVSDAVGTLEAGKSADLLVVDGDPTVDISVLGRAVAVFLGGEQITGPGPG